MSKRKWRSGIGESDFEVIAAELLSRLDEIGGGEGRTEAFGPERGRSTRREGYSELFRERDFLDEYRELLGAEGPESGFDFFDGSFGFEGVRKEGFGAGRKRRGGVLRRGLRRREAGAAAERFYEIEAGGDSSLGGVLTDGQELGQSGLPEKLSEVFRRDSRRYDGAFERYQF